MYRFNEPTLYSNPALVPTRALQYRQNPYRVVSSLGQDESGVGVGGALLGGIVVGILIGAFAGYSLAEKKGSKSLKRELAECKSTSRFESDVSDYLMSQVVRHSGKSPSEVKYDMIEAAEKKMLRRRKRK